MVNAPLRPIAFTQGWAVKMTEDTICIIRVDGEDLVRGDLEWTHDLFEHITCQPGSQGYDLEGIKRLIGRPFVPAPAQKVEFVSAEGRLLIRGSVPEADLNQKECHWPLYSSCSNEAGPSFRVHEPGHDKPSSAHHEHLKEGWRCPPLPPGYAKPVAIIGSSGNVNLDFLSFDVKPNGKPFLFSFIAKKQVPQWEWPWVAGFSPKAQDWEQVGFSVSRMHDTCFGHPDEKYMFEHWLNKEQ